MAKEKKKKERKGFFKEFKEFITRGNVLDMAVGVIIGGAFSAIVTALSEHILKPLINWVLAAILGKDSLDGVFTFLKKAYVEGSTTVVDLENSIYIDWGTFINAVINFLLIALVLFVIIKVFMKLSALRKEAQEKIEQTIEKRIAEREAEKAAAEAEQASKEGETQEGTPETSEPVDTPPVSEETKEVPKEE